MSEKQKNKGTGAGGAQTNINGNKQEEKVRGWYNNCLLYTSPSPRD